MRITGVDRETGELVDEDIPASVLPALTTDNLDEYGNATDPDDDDVADAHDDAAIAAALEAFAKTPEEIAAEVAEFRAYWAAVSTARRVRSDAPHTGPASGGGSGFGSGLRGRVKRLTSRAQRNGRYFK